MSRDPRPDDARDHIASIAARSDADTARLAAMMQRACWPGGGDRTERAAVAWLKRWRPSSGGAPRIVCGCAQGRCALCN